MTGAQEARPAMSDAQALLEIARALGTTSNLDALLEMVIKYSMALLEAERATLFLYDAGREELVSRIAEGTGEVRISVHTGIAGAAARSRQSINIPDAYADERFNRTVDEKTGYRTRSILACPLTDYEGGLVGVLQVLNKRGRPFDERDAALAEAFSAQAGVALQRSHLLEAFLEKRRLEESLRIAQEIQQRLLPREAPAVAGFDLAVWNRPCDATGGDYCDFLPLGDGRVVLTLGDVSGHGVGPALVSCAARAMLRCLASLSDRVDEVMGRVNRLLSSDLPDNRFVTAFLGILDGKTGELTFCSAGQGPLMWLHAAEGEVETLGADGIPVGVMEEFVYGPPRQARLAAGDVFVLLTDGFYEWSRSDGEQFGLERAAAVLRQQRQAGAREILVALRRAVEEFSDTRQTDDLTAIIIKRHEARSAGGSATE